MSFVLARNWRSGTNRTVNPVQNQGGCESGWVFAACGSMEAAYAIANNLYGPKLVEFSEQQIIDCSKSYGNNEPCKRGFQDAALTYAMDNGMMTSQQYPYKNGIESPKECLYTHIQSVLF